MFRRNLDKDQEDSNLFNSDATAQTGTATESTTAAPASAAAAPASTASYAAPASSSAAPASAMSRPATESRTATPPTANAFRPNASPASADLTRTRMPAPEAKNAGMSTGVGIDKANKTGRRVLTVGNDILLKGEIATCDRLVIEGKVDATLNDVHTVEIAETGSFKGSANIEDAEISGLFEGDLVVRNRLVIYATGKVRGKISYGEIEIERGGELTGEIKTTSPTSASARPARAGAKEAVAA